MALLWIDGFEKYGNSGASVLPADILSWKYAAAFGDYCNVVAGRNGGKCLRVDSTSTYVATPDLGPSGNTLIVGMAFKMENLNNNQWIMDLRDPTNRGETVGYGQFTVKIASVNSANEVRIYRGNTALATSNGLDLQAETWYYIEVKVYAHNSSGTCNVRIAEGDGVTTEVISFSGDTLHRTLPYSRVMWHIVSSELLRIDDFYVCDGSGSVCNDFLGNSRVETLSPTSDILTDWTSTTEATLWENIEEDRQDARAIYDTTSGNQALFEITDTTANASSEIVRGVMVCCDSQTANNFLSYAKCITQNGSGGSVQDTGNFLPGTDEPLAYSVIMENDPDGNSWTPSTVNDLRIGVEVA
jgi:hypothetical protein